MNSDYDILILGAGLVGSSLACALDGRGLRIGLLEGSAPAIVVPGFDERRLALAAASSSALASLGVLGRPSPASPIRRIHVSREGDFGAVRLDAIDYGREQFGGVIAASELGKALDNRVSELADLTLFRPATVRRIEPHPDHVEVLVDLNGASSRLRARLLVAADGTRSMARQSAGIGTTEYDYGQRLFVCSLSAERDADGTAYERFTDQGPVALLPTGKDYGAICAVASEGAEAIAALDDEAYASYFQQRFGWRAGRVRRVGKRSSHPARRVVADRLVEGRVVLVGNAAQTIHPVGAQGFNLGLRDALTLAECIDPADPGSSACLLRHIEARREDRERTLAFSDGLARLTSNSGLPVRLGRSLGLLALAHVPGLSAPLVAGAMGFRGRVPSLARELR